MKFLMAIGRWPVTTVYIAVVATILLILALV